MKGTVLITGATSGIGLEFANIFAKQNYYLVLVGRNQKKLQELRKKFGSQLIKGIALDLTNKKAPQAIYHELAKATVAYVFARLV